MRREELSLEDQKRHLAGVIRNMMTAPGSVFSPWYGLDFSYRDGVLCQASPNASSFQRKYTKIMDASALHDATDEEIWRMVMEGKR